MDKYKYIAVRTQHYDWLINAVNHAMDEGYIPIGGVSIQYEREGLFKKRTLFLQSMIMKDI